jgi:K+-sensing histidine kinase KdpD
MVGLILCLLAISAVTVTCLFAGRVAALTLNLVAVGIGLLLAPPALSFRVENPEDVVALLFQSIVGFVVAFRFPARKPRNSRRIADAQPRLTPARASNH